MQNMSNSEVLINTGVEIHQELISVISSKTSLPDVGTGLDDL